MRAPYLLLIGCSMLSAQPIAAQAPGGDTTVDWPTGATIGEGWDVLTGRRTQSCLKDVNTTSPNPADRHEWVWEEVTNQTSLRERLGLTASASYWGGTSVTAKVQFAESNKIDQYSINFLARQVIHGEPALIMRDEIQSDKQRLLERDPLKFRQKCGTHFIRGAIRGGEYYALLTLREFRQEYRQSITALLSASGVAFKGEISAESEIERSEYASHVKVDAKKWGGFGAAATTPSALRQDFEAFRAQLQDHNSRPKLKAVMVPYPSTGGLDPRAADLERAAGLFVTYLDYEGDLAYLGQHTASFYVEPQSVRKLLPAVRGQIQNYRYDLYEKMRKCSVALRPSDVRAACLFDRFPEPPADSKDLPKRWASSCEARTVSISPLRGFTGFVRVAGDASMGGGDMLDFATQLRSSGQDSILLSLHARAYETGRWDTRYEKAVKDHPIWSNINSGCYIKSSLDLSDDFANTRVAAPVNAHGYTRLYPPSSLIADVTCRTNTGGHDDGYVGCSEINLLPIPADLEHLELQDDPSLPTYAYPTWLPENREHVIPSPPPPETLFEVSK